MAKKTTKTKDFEKLGDPEKYLVAGPGGATHQTAEGAQASLTTNQGVIVADNQNTLKSGGRGPSLLEDFAFREKITHFDHERIPERIVHARGSGAHGYFEVTNPIPHLTRASFLAEKGKKTEVFARFSTVAGGAGAGDMPRDVRGFAVKFYTDEGNFDLVGNNIPVFFIQDAIKFPDLIHSVKMEPDRGYPQDATAHDTFWDFISLLPESMNMVLWIMSDRTIPRSLRMMEGFGIHTFRLVNADGNSTFVKFHWRPTIGSASVIWDEAVRSTARTQTSIAATSMSPSPRALFPSGSSASRPSTKNRRRVSTSTFWTRPRSFRRKSFLSRSSGGWSWIETPSTSSRKPSRPRFTRVT